MRHVYIFHAIYKYDIIALLRINILSYKNIIYFIHYDVTEKQGSNKKKMPSNQFKGNYTHNQIKSYTYTVIPHYLNLMYLYVQFS